MEKPTWTHSYNYYNNPVAKCSDGLRLVMSVPSLERRYYTLTLTDGTDYVSQNYADGDRCFADYNYITHNRLF